MGKLWTQIELSEGVNRAEIGSSNFKFIKEFGVLNLRENREYVLEASAYETGLMILEGRCDVGIDRLIETGIGSRESVFSGKPTALYIPINTELKIRSSKASIGVCRAKCSEKTVSSIIRPEDVRVMNVGNDNWSREVRIVIGPDSPSVNMIVGETINPPGNWSGTPPHKHEGNEILGESLHEELYYFKTDRPQGWGIERLYSPDRGINELIFLKENIVTFMPWGYHQIVSAPGYTLYYLFFLAGKGKKLSGFEDPDHNWIKTN